MQNDEIELDYLLHFFIVDYINEMKTITLFEIDFKKTWLIFFTIIEKNRR